MAQMRLSQTSCLRIADYTRILRKSNILRKVADLKGPLCLDIAESTPGGTRSASFLPRRSPQRLRTTRGCPKTIPGMQHSGRWEVGTFGKELVLLDILFTVSNHQTRRLMKAASSHGWRVDAGCVRFQNRSKRIFRSSYSWTTSPPPTSRCAACLHNLYKPRPPLTLRKSPTKKEPRLSGFFTLYKSFKLQDKALRSP